MSRRLLAGALALGRDYTCSSWCREHPILVGTAAGLLVVGGALAAGYLALQAAGPGMQGG